MENTRRLLQRYRSRRRFARLSPKESFPCAPDYFCLVWLWKRCQTYAVRLKLQAMRRRLLIAVLVCSLAGTATAPGREPIRKGDVAVVALQGEVAPPMLAFLRRAVKTAESNEASAIVFEMNTYGGRSE